MRNPIGILFGFRRALRLVGIWEEIKMEQTLLTKYYRLNVILLFICLFSYDGFAQVVFDVKTKVELKENLHIVKIALINILNKSNWANVKEIGENYSLWIDNFTQQANGDSIIAEYDIDLRTPSMFTMGRYIKSKHIVVSFDTVGLSQIPVKNDTTINDLLIMVLERSKILDAFIRAVSNYTTGGAISPVLIKSFIINVLNKINRKPTLFESIEANLLAAKTILELKNMTPNIGATN